MSGPLRPTDADLARWSALRPEPVILAIAGRVSREVETGQPNERRLVWTDGAPKIVLARWWDRPLYPGGPIREVSRRKLRAKRGPDGAADDSVTVEVVSADVFEG